MKNIKQKAKLAFYGLMGTAVTSPAFASSPTNVRDVSTNISNTGTSVIDAILVICAVVGFIFFITAGSKLLSDRNNQQESDAGTWKKLALGIFLMAPIFFMSLVFNSVTNTGGEKDIREVIDASQGVSVNK